MTEQKLENFLIHYGVKGMKWGRHKNKSSASTKKVSRKENRQLNRQARSEFYEKKAQSILSEAEKKQDKVLIATRLPNDMVPTLLTGKEFANHMKRGGYMDVRMTEIYARRDDEGPFVVNDNKIGDYKKQNFRKNPPR